MDNRRVRSMSDDAGSTSADRISDWERVIAVLTDSAYTVIEPPPGGEPGTLAWLRASVSRFSNGGTHAMRRERVQSESARLGANNLGGHDLRGMAAARTLAILATSNAEPMAGIGSIAFDVPVAVLADALGFTDPERMAALVRDISAAYFTGEGTPATDAAVRELRAGAASAPDNPSAETVVARMCILIQAYEATGRLIERAARSAVLTAHRAKDVESILDEVLRRDPPVAVLRRQDSAGRIIELDMAAAERSAPADHHAAQAPLTFGIGRRQCPASAQAIEITTGVVTAIRDHCRNQEES